VAAVLGNEWASNQENLDNSPVCSSKRGVNIVPTYASLDPDTVSLHPAPLRMETFADSRMFSNTNHRVELYKIGPNLHADDLVVAHIPL